MSLTYPFKKIVSRQQKISKQNRANKKDRVIKNHRMSRKHNKLYNKLTIIMRWFQCWIEKQNNRRKRSRLKSNNKNVGINPGNISNNNVNIGFDL